METFQGTKLTDMTKQLIQKYCEDTGEKPEDVLQNALDQFLNKNEKLKEQFKQAVGGELQEYTIPLFSPFVDFAKDYMKYFSDSGTLEDFFRKLIYRGLGDLHEDLSAFVGKPEHILDKDKWYWKYHHVALANFEEPEETEDC